MTRTDNQAGARNDRKISSLLPPATHPQIRSVAEAGLELKPEYSGNPQVPKTGGAECGAVSAPVGAADARLAELVAVWPELSEVVRGQVYQLAMKSIVTGRR